MNFEGGVGPGSVPRVGAAWRAPDGHTWRVAEVRLDMVDRRRFTPTLVLTMKALRNDEQVVDAEAHEVQPGLIDAPHLEISG